MKKMNKKWFPFLLILFFVLSCSKEMDEDETSQNNGVTIDLGLSEETDWSMSYEILQRINQHRYSLGLSEIKMDTQLASAYAVLHTKHMIEENVISHDNFHLRSAGMINAGALYVAENVAAGYTTAEALVNAWLHSPLHKNIIEGNYTHSGFGVVKNSNGKYFFTHLFYRKD